MFLQNTKYTLLLISTLLISLLSSCEKEDTLEKVELQPNSYENFSSDFVTVENVRQADCNRIRIDIVIQEELIPDSIRKNIFEYRVKIRDPFGKAFLAQRYKGQLVDAFCKRTGYYSVSLYHYKTQKETKQYPFSFTTQ
jgi:hypothetical protein